MGCINIYKQIDVTLARALYSCSSLESDRLVVEMPLLLCVDFDLFR